MTSGLEEPLSSMDVFQLMLLAAIVLFGVLVLALAAKDLWQGCFLTVLVATAAASTDLGPISSALGTLRFPAFIVFALAALNERAKYSKFVNGARPKKVVSVGTLLMTFLSISALSLAVADNSVGVLAQLGMLAVFVLALLVSAVRWRFARLARSDIRLINGTLTIFLVAGFLVLPLGLGFSGERFVGIFSNANTAGLVATIVIPASVAILKWGRSYLPIIGIVAGTLTLLGSQARTSLLALVVAFVVWGMLARGSAKGRAHVLVGGLALIAIGAFALVVSERARSEFSSVFSRFELPEEGGLLLSGRETIWQAAFHVVNQRPILGYGYGNSPPLSPGEIEQQIATGNAVRGIAANSYIQVLVETGLLGFAVIALVAGLLLVVSVQLMRSAELGGIGALVFAGLLVQLTESPLLAPGQFYPWAFWFIALSSMMLLYRHRGSHQIDAHAGPGYAETDFGVGNGA